MNAAAQTPPRPPGEVPYLNFPPVLVPETPPGDAAAANPPLDLRPSDPCAPASPSADALQQRDQELEALRAEQKRAHRERGEAQARDRSDRRRPPQAQSAADRHCRARARVEDEIAKTEERLKPLDEREQTLRKSLDERRGVIAEVLAALQRIGRHPPPAIMVRPEDALQSVRSAMMLGAVLPEMRQETEALVADLAELGTPAQGHRRRARHGSSAISRSLADERPRLALLIEQRQKQQAETEKSLAGERQRAAHLARQADDLKDLIAKLERDLDSAARAGRAAAQRRGRKKVFG